MSSERADQPATPDNAYKAPFPSGNGVPGQVLASQREAMGWTVEQVADQLKLAVRQVTALEAGDYASLPSPAVTRGFVRAYAKLMKLDPAPLVAQIAIETVPTVDNTSHTARRAAPTSFSESRFPNHNKRSRLPLMAMIGGAVALVAAAAGAWKAGVIPMGSHADRADAASASVALPASASATGEATTPGAATETLQNPAVPLISVPGASASASAPAGTAPAPATAATPAVTATATLPAPVAAPAAAAPAVNSPATNAPVAAPTGPNALVLNVRQDSWVEVRPAKGGAPLISRLVKGGSIETVNVDGPVRMLVGNPTGVSVTLRGEPVALPTVPGKTISRVSLQ